MTFEPEPSTIAAAGRRLSHDEWTALYTRHGHDMVGNGGGTT